MAGFRKPKPQQAAIKVGLYGPAGSGKTFTALEIAEGIARREGKRVALIDTEHGSDFYAVTVPQRQVHKDAFDFDALYTRSITESIEALRGLDPKEYAAVIIDSITHLWEAAIDAYSGKKNRAGQIPFHAWGRVKKPYKDLVTFLLNSPMHIIICGRQKNIFEEDVDTGETKMVGVGMKAEGETPYEPHVLIRMGRERVKSGLAPVTAFVEKDRSGTLSGKTFRFGVEGQEDGFTFEQLGAPLLSVLSGTEQAKIQTSDEASTKDAEALALAALEKEAGSVETRDYYLGCFQVARGLEELEKAGKELTPAIKREMLREHVRELKESYTENLRRFK